MTAGHPFAVLDAVVPPGYVRCPDCANVHAPADLDDLPTGVALGDLDPADAPRGAAAVLARVHPAWSWRLLSGEGWCLRQGYGARRRDNTRPKISILEPAHTISLRAVAFDPAFLDVAHHVAIVWTLIHRTGRRTVDTAVAWSTAPNPDGRGRGWQPAPREVGLAACAALLQREPDAPAVAIAMHGAGPASRGATDPPRVPEPARPPDARTVGPKAPTIHPDADPDVVNFDDANRAES
jgi:hypothetical protein